MLTENNVIPNLHLCKKFTSNLLLHQWDIHLKYKSMYIKCTNSFLKEVVVFFLMNDAIFVSIAESMKWLTLPFLLCIIESYIFAFCSRNMLIATSEERAIRTCRFPGL